MGEWEQFTDNFGYTYRVNPLDNDLYCDPCLQQGARCRLEFHYFDVNKVAHYRCEKEPETCDTPCADTGSSGYLGT